MKTYADVSDLTKMGKNPNPEQAEILIEMASAKLRLVASRYGVDIDSLIADEVTGEDYSVVVKNIVVQAVCRALNSLTDTPPITQESQSALGYSASMTYLNAGQSVYFLRNELKELGILRQRFGALELYEVYKDADTGNDNTTL